MVMDVLAQWFRQICNGHYMVGHSSKVTVSLALTVLTTESQEKPGTASQQLNSQITAEHI
jgi:hypothetical protein